MVNIIESVRIVAVSMAALGELPLAYVCRRISWTQPDSKEPIR